jgi:hypothetical protein
MKILVRGHVMAAFVCFQALASSTAFALDATWTGALGTDYNDSGN